MNKNEKRLEGISLLGNQKTKYVFNNPNKNMLETFENQHLDLDYLVTWKCPEFTSLCPKTSQPDFATIYIQYVPEVKCIESKSLKLYLFSFRNFGEFHEDCVCRILKDIRDKINPRYIRVEGQFRQRGGISIVPIVEWSKEGYQVLSEYRKRVEHDYTVT
jgi:7-cyano-7-deazaguanine reductase